MSLSIYLQKQLGVSRTTPYLWWKKGHRVSQKQAEKLEGLFGIPRYNFEWPEVYGDPWPQVRLIYKQNINTTKQTRNGIKK